MRLCHSPPREISRDPGRRTYAVRVVTPLSDARHGQVSRRGQSGGPTRTQTAPQAGVPWDFWTCVAAAEGGHLSCLQYAHENGCDWNSLVCEHAIDGPPGGTGGHMNCLTYAVSNGCPIDALTCAAAAEGGHLECLRFLHENECPWDDRTTYAAVRHEHPECLKFAFENGCPLPAAEDERVQMELKPGIVSTIRFGKV